MSKTTKTILIVCLCILLIPLAFYVFIHLLFIWSLDDSDSYTIKTQYGDKFKVTAEQHDFHHMQCTVSSTNSDKQFYFTNKVEDENIKGLTHTDDLTVYDVIGIVIFDNGDGFQELTIDNIDDNPDVAAVLKDNIMSEDGTFSWYLKLLLNSKQYCREAKKIIDLVEKWDYDKLLEYGLDEEYKLTDETEDHIKERIYKYKRDAKDTFQKWDDNRPHYNDKYNESKSGW